MRGRFPRALTWALSVCACSSEQSPILQSSIDAGDSTRESLVEPRPPEANSSEPAAPETPTFAATEAAQLDGNSVAVDAGPGGAPDASATDSDEAGTAPTKSFVSVDAAVAS